MNNITKQTTFRNGCPTNDFHRHRRTKDTEWHSHCLDGVFRLGRNASVYPGDVLASRGAPASAT